MKRILIYLLLSCMGGVAAQSQTTINLQVDQKEPLQAISNSVIHVCAGTKVDIGSVLTINNAVGDVYFSWFPMDLMDDPTKSNPISRVKKSTHFMVTVRDSRGCAVQTEVVVEATLCDELVRQSSGSVKIYPNPADERITIEMPTIGDNDQVQLKILNSLGQTIEQRLFYGILNDRILNIPTDNIEPGLYYVQLVSGNKLFVERIQIR